MPAVMPYSPLSALLVKTIWMRRISLHQHRPPRAPEIHVPKMRKAASMGAPGRDEKALSGCRRSPHPARLLDPGASSSLREQLLAEIAELKSLEQAATWALQALTAKNTLVAAYAERVESAFQVQLLK